MLDVPGELVLFVFRLLTARRRQIGTRKGTRRLGGNIQALLYPSGIPMWVSDVLPGNVHDLAAARENVLAVLRPFLEAMPALADLGYEGAGHGVHVPVKKPAGGKGARYQYPCPERAPAVGAL